MSTGNACRSLPGRGVLTALAILLALTGGTLRVQGDTAAADAEPRGGFVVTPVAYYTPETRLAFGVVGIHYFRLGHPPPPARLSHYRFNFIRTQNKQTIAEINYELYLNDDRFLLDGQVKYSLYPDRFYGIGNRSPEAREDFASRNWRLQMNMQRRWGDSLFAGLHLDYYSLQVTETAKGGLLAAGDIPGSRGGALSALGLFAKWDSRDNTFSPARGTYCALFLNFFSPVVLASDFTFTQMILDARKYIPLGQAQVLAVQAVFKAVWGDCPFQALPMFGGLNLMRGFYEGRYRDRNMLAVQAEYRRPLWGRFGICGFAGAAQVQNKISRLALGEFHVAGGAGLRYKFNRRENLSVRLDLGFAGPSPAFYLTFAEAF